MFARTFSLFDAFFICFSIPSETSLPGVVTASSPSAVSLQLFDTSPSVASCEKNMYDSYLAKEGI